MNIFLVLPVLPKCLLINNVFSQNTPELRKEGEFLDEKQGKGLPLHPTLVLKVPKVFKKEDLLLVVSSDKHREKKYILTGSSWGGIA